MKAPDLRKIMEADVHVLSVVSQGTVLGVYQSIIVNDFIAFFNCTLVDRTSSL